MVGRMLLLLSVLWTSPSWAAMPPEEIYFQALLQLKAQKWAVAERSLLSLRKLLEKKKVSAGRERHFLDLGRCDVLYLLSKAALGQADRQRACRYLLAFDRLSRRIPKDWQKWSVNPVLPRRMLEGRRSFVACAKIPAVVSLQGLPRKATIERWGRKGQKSGARWLPARSPLPVFQKTLRLRVRADGFFDWEREVQLGRWQRLELVVKLKSRPKVVGPPRRRPPPRPVIAPWVWGVGIGATVLVGGGIAGLLIWNSTRRIDEVTPSIEFRSFRVN